MGERSFDLAGQLFQEAMESFKQKEATIEDVLAAAEDWQESRRGSLESLVACWRAQYRLYAAIGQQLHGVTTEHTVRPKAATRERIRILKSPEEFSRRTET
jgi:outer membrane protein TolC